MRGKLIGIACALACTGAFAQVAMQRTETQAKGTLEVSSPTIPPNAAIPKEHSAYFDDVSPALAWTGMAGAKSYALVMEDPDARSAKPFVHWVAWNIPPTTTSLPEGLKETPAGMVQGAAGRGSAGYFGPRPPAADPPHHYHFAVLALDTMLDLPSGADRDALLKAASGHVLAKGELVGTYDQAEK